MGGESKQTTTQSTQTNPWSEAIPTLRGILGQVNTGLQNTGVTGAESGALDALKANAGNMSQFLPAIQDYAKNLLAGGGALNQSGSINQNFLDYQKNTSGLASNTNYDPYNTPGFRDAIDTLKNDITNSTNGMFAAAGRDFSGANMQTLGRGIMQGVAPVIAQQYNQNVQNQQGAARDLYSAGNTNAGLLSGLQQQYLQNQGAGVGAAGSAFDAANVGANATLQAEAMRRGIPLQSLGLLANIGVPIAGLGSQSTGTRNTTKQEAGVDTFGKWANLGFKAAAFL